MKLDRFAAEDKFKLENRWEIQECSSKGYAFILVEYSPVTVIRQPTRIVIAKYIVEIHNSNL